MNAADIFIKKPVISLIIIIAIILLGIYSFINIPENLLPEVVSLSITINTIFPDAAPEETEEFITKPLESALNSINGLDSISSTSKKEASRINLSFKQNCDMKTAMREVVEITRQTSIHFPKNALEPKIRGFSTSDIPDTVLAVCGNGPSNEIFDTVQDIIQPGLEAVKDVESAVIMNGESKINQIKLNEKLMIQNSISLDMIQNALTEKKYKYYLRENNSNEKIISVFFSGKSEIENIAVSQTGGKAILIKDIASVENVIQKNLTTARYNKINAVLISVYRKKMKSSVAVSENIKFQIKNLKNQNSIKCIN